MVQDFKAFFANSCKIKTWVLQLCCRQNVGAHLLIFGPMTCNQQNV